MAFEQKIWVDRQTEHPGRRRFVATETANVYDIERDEGLEIEAGDAFNAATMNDMERRIAEGLAQAACNPNLLHNWYFGNPVDQRGGYVAPPGVGYFDTWGGDITGTTDRYYTATHTPGGYADQYQITVNGAVKYVVLGRIIRGYTGAGYSIDRWKLGGAAMALTADGVQLQAAATFQQPLGGDISGILNGKQVTFSAMVNGELVSGTATWSGTAVKFYEDSNISLRFSGAGNPYLSSTTAVTVSAVKLELGAVQTLAHQENGVWVLNEIPNKAEETFKCIHSTADNTDPYANIPVSGYTYGTADIQAGTASPYPNGHLHFVIE